jgi:hypothetical protein
MPTYGVNETTRSAGRMQWLKSVLIAYAILFLAFGYLLYSPSWILFGIFLLTLILLAQYLMHSIRVFAACLRIVSSSTPGDWKTLIQLADDSYNDGYYTVVEHGQWPNKPVLFLVNYPNEILEYWYFGWVAKKCNLTVMTRSIQHLHTRLLSFFTSCNFKEDENYIPVPIGRGHFDTIAEKLHMHIHKRQRSVYAYPEEDIYLGKPLYGMRPLRRGLFHIAEKYSLPIVVLAWSHLASAHRNIHVIISSVLTGTAEATHFQVTRFFDDAMTRLAFYDRCG